jgi:hypothetical protein
LKSSEYESYWNIKSITNFKDLEKYIKSNIKDFTRYEWLLVSGHSAFNIKLIDTYADELDWQMVSMLQKLDIKTIEKYSGYVDWYAISKFQHINYKFIKKYQDVLSMNKVVENEYVRKLPEFTKIEKLYKSMINNPKFENVWKENFLNNSIFRPYKKTPTGLKSTQQIITNTAGMKKDQLKAILTSRGVRVYYHDTIEELKRKVKESDLGDSI